MKLVLSSVLSLLIASSAYASEYSYKQHALSAVSLANGDLQSCAIYAATIPLTGFHRTNTGYSVTTTHRSDVVMGSCQKNGEKEVFTINK